MIQRPRVKRRLLFVALGLAGMAAVVAIHPVSRTFLGSIVAPRATGVVAVTSEQQLRDAFNAHADRTRVVAWLSPT